MDPLSNTKKPSVVGSSTSSPFLAKYGFGGDISQGQQPWDSANQSTGKTSDQDYHFELEAVQDPYQTIIEYLFILSSVLALVFNISALLLIFRRNRRNNSLSLPTMRVFGRKWATSNGGKSPNGQATSRVLHASFGSSQLRVYLVNLFINDILIALFTTPFGYTDFMYGQWIYAPILCPITNFISTCAVSVSVYTLIAIGLERYFAIIYPFKKLAFFERHTKVIILLIWIIGIILGTPTLIQSRAVPFTFRNRTLYDCRELWEQEMGSKIYTGVIFAATFLIPFVAITFLYVSIAIKAFRHVIPGNADAGRDQIQLKNKIRIIRMLVFLVITFVICWLPIQSFNMVMWLCDRCRSSFSTPLLVQLYVTVTFICQWLSIAHSMLDPIIYCFNSRNFNFSEIAIELRRLRKSLFDCCRSDKEHSVTNSVSETEMQQSSSRASYVSSFSVAHHHHGTVVATRNTLIMSARINTGGKTTTATVSHRQSSDSQQGNSPNGFWTHHHHHHHHNQNPDSGKASISQESKRNPLISLVSSLFKRDNISSGGKDILFKSRQNVAEWPDVASI